MPRFKVALANGKTLTLEGDTPPSDSDIESAADAAGVRSLLMHSGGADDDRDSSDGGASAGGMGLAGEALAGAAAAAPKILSGINTAAVMGGKLATGKAAAVAPAAVAVDAVRNLAEGKPKTAAAEVAGAYATTKVAPRLLTVLARLTGPIGGLSTAANIASKASGPLALATAPKAISDAIELYDQLALSPEERAAKDQKFREQYGPGSKFARRPWDTATEQAAREVIAQMEKQR